jgi:hypothetical protein
MARISDSQTDLPTARAFVLTEIPCRAESFAVMLQLIYCICIFRLCPTWMMACIFDVIVIIPSILVSILRFLLESAAWIRSLQIPLFVVERAVQL